MENTATGKLTGTVIYLRTNEGSKSECVAPFLYQGRNVKPTRLVLKDDNPFENNGFIKYDGTVVSVSGQLSSNGTFVAESVDSDEKFYINEESKTETNI